METLNDIEKPNILIVDDSPENLFTLHSVLDTSEYDLTECLSGEEALRNLLTKDFDLVIMDVRMPGLTGFETAELMRKRKESETIPLIFVTACMMDEGSAMEGYKVGAVDYLTKPFWPEVLKKKVAFFSHYNRAIKKIQHDYDLKELLNISNEFINPLWAILLNIQILKKYAKDEDKKKLMGVLDKKLELMEQSVKRIERMLNAFASQLG